MHLTAEGQFFVTQFKEILGRLEQLENDVNTRQQKVAGQLKITSPDNSEGLDIHSLIVEFMRRFPNVSISWLQLNRYMNLVDEGIDLAVRFGELSDSNLIARRFSSSPVYFVASPKFISQFGNPNHPNELKGFACIVEVSEKQSGKWRYSENSKECFVNISGRMEVNRGPMVAKVAASGGGIAQLPEFMVQPYIESGELVTILHEYQPSALPYSLVYPSNRLVNPALKALVDFLLKKREDLTRTNLS